MFLGSCPGFILHCFSKGWWLRPALTASRLSFWAPPECIGIKFYPGSVDGTFEGDPPPVLECRDQSVWESAHLRAVTNGTCIWRRQSQSPDQFGSLTYTSSQLQGWGLLKNIGIGACTHVCVFRHTHTYICIYIEMRPHVYMLVCVFGFK